MMESAPRGACTIKGLWTSGRISRQQGLSVKKWKYSPLFSGEPFKSLFYFIDLFIFASSALLKGFRQK